MAQTKRVISAQQSKIIRNIILQTFTPITKLQIKEKKIFQKPDIKRDSAIFAINEMIVDLRTLLLLSKTRKLIFPYIGTKGFKNVQTSPKYHKRAKFDIKNKMERFS